MSTYGARLVDRKQTKQLQDIIKKAKTTSVLIAISPLTRYGATLAYCGIFVPSVKYPLPQSFFAKTVLEAAQRKVMGIIIAKCGYNRKTAGAILYALSGFGGGGFIHFYTLQGEGQIQQFIKHWRTVTIISRTLRIDAAEPMAIWTVDSVAQRSEYTDSLPRVPLVPKYERLPRSHWWDYYHAPERAGTDIHIMDYAIDFGIFSDADMHILNYCRLYLHATTISELFDAAGLQILSDMFQCRRPTWFDPDTIITIQKRPSDYQIKYVWQ
jgi:hypothetical protein